MEVIETPASVISSPEHAARPLPTFQFGDFVRLVQHPHLWGIIIGPSEHEGRWIFEYSQGARVTNQAEVFELFLPTAAQRRQMERRLAQLATASVAVWPDYVA